MGNYGVHYGVVHSNATSHCTGWGGARYHARCGGAQPMVAQPTVALPTRGRSAHGRSLSPQMPGTGARLGQTRPKHAHAAARHAAQPLQSVSASDHGDGSDARLRGDPSHASKDVATGGARRVRSALHTRLRCGVGSSCDSRSSARRTAPERQPPRARQRERRKDLPAARGCDSAIRASRALSGVRGGRVCAS